MTTATTTFKNTKKGYPLILHSFKPYSPFNFQAYAQFTLIGDYTWVGIIGLSKDANNYIVGRYNGTTVELCKVRAGELTVLSSASFPKASTLINIVFSHRDGLFKIYLNDDGVTNDPVLTYRWESSDLDPISVDNDLFHVGVYSFLDPPKIRITSFDINNCEGIPYLPGTDISRYSTFPDSGRVQIDDAIYSYTNKINNGLEYYRGPYQVKNIGSSSYTNPESGFAYSGKYMEVAMFDWTNDRNDFNGYLLATDAKYAWLITDLDRKVFLNSTSWFHNRARFFCNSYGVVSTTHRAWVTIGLTGLSVYQVDGSTPTHNMGSLCFYDSSDSAELHMFIASSGEKDATIGDLLKLVGKTSGIETLLSGDLITPAITLSSTKTVL